MYKRQGLLALLKEIKRYRPQAETLVYSGYNLEDLLDDCPEHFAYIDILVDGPYIAELDTQYIMWRGSLNQLPINISASPSLGEPVTLDWESPEIIIDTDGAVLGPIGIIDDFQGAGQVKETRRCGQTK